ncbi:amino acid transporter, partial [Aureobasidium melanogenum]
TAAGIPTWSPTVVLICRSTAYVWQSGRDAQFSADCGHDSATSSSNDVFPSHEIVSTTGDLKFVVEQGCNGSQPSYQEVSGAPVETKSSLGYAVGPVTIVLINVGKMIGTGVYSTPATILKGTGSVGTSMIFWALGLLTSGTSLAVYLEYASYFPNRSGSEVVYLEQAFPRPKYFFP